jgi:hypothetical protein
VFGLDASELVRLADAGVPARVTDAMVAVSNPDVFAVARPEETARSRARLDDDIAGRRVYVYMDPMYSPYRWGYTPYGYGYGYGYGSYGYTPLGYGGYGGGYSGYPGYVPPIVIVNPQQPVTRGRAVKGRGYTQGDASPSTATPSNARGSASSSSSGSSSQPARSEPARSEPAPRTAHPKP